MQAVAIVGVVGLFLLLAGWRARTATARFARRAQRTTGEIVELRKGRARYRPGSASGPMVTAFGSSQFVSGGVSGSARSGPVFYPVVTFTTGDGRAMRLESKLGTNPAAGRVGESVPILYDPANPSDFRIDSRLGRQTWAGTLLLGLGGVLVAIAIVIVVAAH